MGEAGRNNLTGPTEQRAAMLRTMQILIGALIIGVISFGCVVAALVLTGNGPLPASQGSGAARGGLPLASMLLLVMGVLTVVSNGAGFWIRRQTVASLRRSSDAGEELNEGDLLARFQTTMVVRGAMAEGPALFGVVIVLISGAWLGFAGTGFGLLVLLAIFPTRAKFDGFVGEAKGRVPGM